MSRITVTITVEGPAEWTPEDVTYELLDAIDRRHDLVLVDIVDGKGLEG